jgi:hypothetical protein
MIRLFGVNLMDPGNSLGKARCAARCGASGKQRNAADELPGSTEGRVLSWPGCVATLIRCSASHRALRLARQGKNLGQMAPNSLIML